MKYSRAAADFPRPFTLASAVGLLLLTLAALVAANKIRDTRANPAEGTISACVSRYTGQTRVIQPGQTPNCSQAEVLVEWNGEGIQGPPGPPGPEGAPGATNVTRRVSDEEFADPGGVETATVECLEGEQVTGGGFVSDENPEELLPILLESDVSDAGNGWKVKIYSFAFVPDGLGFRAVAMCASP